MFKYYLGAFGNRSFIRPQYEIMDNGKLRQLEDRWREFPNGGTVTVAHMTDNEADSIKNRLLKFKIDLNKDFNREYDSYRDNSNKYQIDISAIEEFNRDDIIEILNIEYPIKEFLDDKTKRTLRIKHTPNKLILLRYENNCYGPFEFMISDIEETSYSDEVYYTLKVFVNSGAVNEYKYSDLERHVVDGCFSIRRADAIQFLYHLDELEDIEPSGRIDYFETEELVDFLGKLLEKSDSIENIASIKNQLMEIIDTFAEEDQLSDQRMQRICELVTLSEDLRDYKVRLTEEYFKCNPNAESDKNIYLETHEELLERLAREDLKYDETVKKLQEELENIKKEKEILNLEINASRNKLNDQQAELEKLGKKALEEKEHELENLKEKIREASDELKKQQSTQEYFKQQKKLLSDECNEITNDINSKLNKWVADKRNSEILKVLTSRAESVEDVNSNMDLSYLEKVRYEFNSEDIVKALDDKFKSANRRVTKDELYNYLISIVQNYITVFAGEPGTGKTSLCKLLAKSLGLYTERFAEVLVERGWTSSRDLIGYYNPLTQNIEKAQPAFSKCIEQLDIENRENKVSAPYFVLLDEANLSPIEFYWSHFNYYNDNPEHQVIKYANGREYNFGGELKFLATVNYDQTTVDLSPRFLDRAWIISMGPVSTEQMFTDLIDDNDIENNKEITSLKTLNECFGWKTYEGKSLNRVTKDRLNRIIDKMKEGNHAISPRSIQAMLRYYLVAEEYMSSKEVALDYAIAQKILPCISGHGKQYREFLN
ncbi:MAG: hypothetical protein SPH11_04340 [Lentihominibacter sp.]|uniref:hypothetical protein n=1 Tax=Lentihominibacter sp. TaxID=2944216 RepID=UPI002A90B627|nr:hypothetical protein [Lentihominibacter sp.]MDY5286975.1 hypothetical protein [Lentihominibacter sp.]